MKLSSSKLIRVTINSSQQQDPKVSNYSMKENVFCWLQKVKVLNQDTLNVFNLSNIEM